MSFRELKEEWNQLGLQGGEEMKTAVLRRVSPEQFDASGERVAMRCTQALPPEVYPRIIDFGCGPGRVTTWLAIDYAEVVAVDIARSMIARIPEADSITPIQDDGTHLAEKIGYQVDGVFSVIALQHNSHEDVTRIIASMAEVLRPGGRAAIQLPIYENSHDPTGPQKVGEWTKEEFLSDVEAAGLIPKVVFTNPGSYVKSNPRRPGTHHFALHQLDKPLE